MGSYAGLSIGGKALIWWKNGLSPIATSLFTKDDVLRGSGQAGVDLIEQYRLEQYRDDYTVEDLNWEIVLAVIDIATLRQRLSIYGYNQETFDTAITELITQQQEMLTDADHDMKAHYKKEIETLCKIRDNSLPLRHIDHKLLEDLEIYDELMAIWIVLQNDDIKDDDVAIIDLDDLAEGGWLDDEFSNTDSTYMIPEGRFTPEVPIIITEGVSDERFLRESLAVIYPKLVNNIRFLDSTFRPERSASSAIKMIKSFASAGISNRTLVVLDNDAAASDAIKDLPTKMPNNIKVIQYPDLKWLENYPTIGPQGEVFMDVNGLAGSIEMYLGKDVLLDDGGNLTRVQWRGYMDRVKKYQGSLVNKGDVQSRFDAKDKNVLEQWQDLKSVWDFIIDQLSTF